MLSHKLQLYSYIFDARINNIYTIMRANFDTDWPKNSERLKTRSEINRCQKRQAKHTIDSQTKIYIYIYTIGLRGTCACLQYIHSIFARVLTRPKYCNTRAQNFWRQSPLCRFVANTLIFQNKIYRQRRMYIYAYITDKIRVEKLMQWDIVLYIRT